MNRKLSCRIDVVEEPHMKPEAAVSGEHVRGTFSMESALEAATPGATIHIPAGEYHAKPGGWRITKSVTLAGEMTADGEHAVTLFTGDIPAFVIALGTVDVTIANITFIELRAVDGTA